MDEFNDVLDAKRRGYTFSRFSDRGEYQIYDLRYSKALTNNISALVLGRKDFLGFIRDTSYFVEQFPQYSDVVSPGNSQKFYMSLVNKIHKGFLKVAKKDKEKEWKLVEYVPPSTLTSLMNEFEKYQNTIREKTEAEIYRNRQLNVEAQEVNPEEYESKFSAEVKSPSSELDAAEKIKPSDQASSLPSDNIPLQEAASSLSESKQLEAESQRDNAAPEIPADNVEINHSMEMFSRPSANKLSDLPRFKSPAKKAPVELKKKPTVIKAPKKIDKTVPLSDLLKTFNLLDAQDRINVVKYTYDEKKAEKMQRRAEQEENVIPEEDRIRDASELGPSVFEIFEKLKQPTSKKTIRKIKNYQSAETARRTHNAAKLDARKMESIPEENKSTLKKERNPAFDPSQLYDDSSSSAESTDSPLPVSNAIPELIDITNDILSNSFLEDDAKVVKAPEEQPHSQQRDQASSSPSSPQKEQQAASALPVTKTIDTQQPVVVPATSDTSSAEIQSPPAAATKLKATSKEFNPTSTANAVSPSIKAPASIAAPTPTTKLKATSKEFNPDISNKASSSSTALPAVVAKTPVMPSPATNPGAGFQMGMKHSLFAQPKSPSIPAVQQHRSGAQQQPMSALLPSSVQYQQPLAYPGQLNHFQQQYMAAQNPSGQMQHYASQVQAQPQYQPPYIGQLQPQQPSFSNMQNQGLQPQVDPLMLQWLLLQQSLHNAQQPGVMPLFPQLNPGGFGMQTHTYFQPASAPNQQDNFPTYPQGGNQNRRY